MATNERLHNLSQALSQIVTGAYILTVKDGAEAPTGILLSFVQQVGLRPPRIAVALRKERGILDALERVRAFVLNICADSDQRLLKEFVETPDDSARLLAQAGARELGAGLVLETCAGYLVCKVVERVDIGEHWMYIADVLDGAAVAGRSPLVHVRRSGLQY